MKTDVMIQLEEQKKNKPYGTCGLYGQKTLIQKLNKARTNMFKKGFKKFNLLLKPWEWRDE